ASAARSSASGPGRPRPQAAASTANATALRAPGRNEALGRPLQVVAQQAGQVEEDLRRDARITVLDAPEEALVERQHVHVARRDDVRRPLGVPDEAHLAEDVAATELVDPLTPGAVAR